MELSEKQLAYVEWRSNPHREGDKKEWAEANGISRTTIYNWEKAPWFRDALERRNADLNIAPDRIQEILDRLWREAKDGDTQAAKLYFAEIERIRPPAPTQEDRSIASLTDEELELAWAEGMAALKRSRV